jgi:hypothetical protein
VIGHHKFFCPTSVSQLEGIAEEVISAATSVSYAK